MKSTSLQKCTTLQNYSHRIVLSMKCCNEGNNLFVSKFFMICLQRASDYISISITLWFHSFCYYNSYEIDSIHEWKESFDRSSIHPLNMSNKTKASVDVATFQVAQTKKNYEQDTIIKKHTSRGSESTESSGSDHRKTDFLLFMFWFDLLFLLYAYLYDLFLRFFSERFHFKYTFVWGVYIKIESSYAEQQGNYILNEMKEWMNEKSSKIIQVAENIKSPRTHTRKLVKSKQQKSVVYISFDWYILKMLLVKMTFCSLNYLSALFARRSSFPYINVNSFLLSCFASLHFHCSQSNHWQQKNFDQIKSP